MSGLSMGAARDFSLAVPDNVTDMYALHQMVWSQFDRILRRENMGRMNHDASFLYRRNAGLVTVRSAALRAAGQQNPCPLRQGIARKIRVCLAPFRDAQQRSKQDVDQAINRVFERTGVSLLQFQVIDQGVGVGQKVIDGRVSRIELPFFELEAEVVQMDPCAAQEFWNIGAGRGRRFGFGMPVLA